MIPWGHLLNYERYRRQCAYHIQNYGANLKHHEGGRKVLLVTHQMGLMKNSMRTTPRPLPPGSPPSIGRVSDDLGIVWEKCPDHRYYLVNNSAARSIARISRLESD